MIAPQDVFETKAFIYIVTERLMGGELFDRLACTIKSLLRHLLPRIVARGSYSENDASKCVRLVRDWVECS